MKTITYSNMRANFARNMTKVCEDHAPYLITRTQAEPVVMLSFSDYAAMEETCYLLESPTNAKRLATAIDEIETLIKKRKKVKRKDK